ncbi:IS110 family transposase [Kitasatospora aureofaciens]|uniref:IS110 family transposase n=1 Tax=Kitasatospora aureofaciens TaxID=1894 RepID=UPI0037CB6504
MSVYVGIDVHRKRSQIAVVDEAGEVQVNRNVPNGVETVLGVIGDLSIGTPVAFEAAYGWGWLVELLEDYGYQPHLVHPLQCKAIASARLKNDKVDAATLGQLLRADLLPEAWIAPLEVRQQRALLRHRFQLVRLRTLLRNRIHAVLADLGHTRPTGGCFTGPGRAWLAGLPLPDASRHVVDDLLAVMDALQPQIDALDRDLAACARGDPRVAALRELPGVGLLTALAVVAEVGDITRFPSARKLASWAGLTPTVRNSDRTVHHGHISKQGSPWLRWIMCEAAQTAKRHPSFAPAYQEMARRRGKKIATTAVARKLLTHAYHVLRDLHERQAACRRPTLQLDPSHPAVTPQRLSGNPSRDTRAHPIRDISVCPLTGPTLMGAEETGRLMHIASARPGADSRFRRAARPTGRRRTETASGGSAIPAHGHPRAGGEQNAPPVSVPYREGIIPARAGSSSSWTSPARPRERGAGLRPVRCTR